MTATIPSATVLGVNGLPVEVEAHVGNGLPIFTLVGLPDNAVREARDRVRAAIQESGLSFPDRRMTVNLAPSSIRKAGSALDLPIAIGLLVANGDIPSEAVADTAFFGELGLDGTLRAVPGVVPMVDAISVTNVVVPMSCAVQAAVLGRHRVRAAGTLKELVSALKGERPWPDAPQPRPPERASEPDLSEVRGQAIARWALEVAAAGGHNLMMTGTPGSGKTMLARRLPGLLPDLSVDAALAVTKIHSAAGLLDAHAGLVTRPPFRSPHHTCSGVALTGGGSSALRPGEASLAHEGVLFLDELIEFSPSSLDALRQPLEEGFINISRVHAQATLPARFQCVTAANPCPCGEGISKGMCRCNGQALRRYENRISGPLRDRFDLRIKVARPKVDQFFDAPVGESTALVRGRVEEARARALHRSGVMNAALSAAALEAVAPLAPQALSLLRSEMRAERLTARGMQRIRRVARTLADLDGSAVLADHHVAAALQLRVDDDPEN